MIKKSVAVIIIENLRDMGVKHIFGVPSGGWVDFMEAIRNTDGIEFVLATHEGGAGFMADVSGRLTGVPGVCFGTFGPGATNLATGVGSALMDRSPLIALTDEMPDAMTNRVTQMGIDHQILMKPVTKWTTRLSLDDVTGTFEKAFGIAMNGRPGAVHIGMPVNVTTQMIEARSFQRPLAKPIVNASAESIENAKAAITNSKKPMMVLGLGAVRSKIQDKLIDFAKQQGMPVVLTPMAKGLITENHPNYAGVLFHALSDQIAATHKQTDLVVAIGYDPVEFNYENWMQPVKLINIDDEPLDIDFEIYPDYIQVEGDIAVNFTAISKVLPTPRDWDMGALRDRLDSIFDQMSPDNLTFGPCAVLDILRDVLPKDGIMTCDVGAHTHLIGQKWLTPTPGTQIMTNGWSSMGFGLPSAIAAKLCYPEKSVCTVVGDGGFLMTAGEIATAVREKLNVVIVVLTDNDLALIRIKQQRKDNPIFGTPIRETGSIGGDNIFGAPVMVSRNPVELRTNLEKAFKMDGPVIVENLVSSAEYDELVLKKDKS